MNREIRRSYGSCRQLTILVLMSALSFPNVLCQGLLETRVPTNKQGYGLLGLAHYRSTAADTIEEKATGSEDVQPSFRRAVLNAKKKSKKVPINSECAEMNLTKRYWPPRDGIVKARKGNLYADQEEDLYFESILMPSSVEHHASAIVAVTGKDKSWRLLCAWFGGVEGSSSVSIFLSSISDSDTQWSVPVEVARNSERSLQNPVWLWDDNWLPAATKFRSTLRLLYTSQRGLKQETSHVEEKTSPNLGVSWGAASTVFQLPGIFIKSPAIRGSQPGEWLLPVYHTPGGAFRDIDSQYSELKRSSDGGQTWDEGVPLSSPGSGLVQPSIVRLPDGRLVAFFRQRRSGNETLSFVWRSESADDGWNWTDPSPTPLPNPNKAVQALALTSGAILIVFNNNRGEVLRERDEHGRRRIVDTRHYPLSAGLSYDGGRTWPYVRDLEEAYSRRLEYSYPSVAQTPDGWIHITHTWSQDPCRRCAIRYQRIREDWVKRGWDWGSTRGVYQPRGDPWQDRGADPPASISWRRVAALAVAACSVALVALQLAAALPALAKPPPV